jgi:hypothetical protein
MQFRPRFNHALLSLWQIARNQFNGINSINSDFILIVGMKVRHMVLDANFHIHTNDNSEKPAQFGHGEILFI